MNGIENTQSITEIVMKPTAITKCEIGQDWYTNRFEIYFYPLKEYPDYMIVNEWIMKNIDGKELNIEDVVDLIYRYLEETYQPRALRVRNHVEGCKTHFDVIVEK